MTSCRDSKNSRRMREVTFSKNDGNSRFWSLRYEIDILWYQSGAERINKTIKNIIWLILYYIFIKNCQTWSKMIKKCQKSYEILWNPMSAGQWARNQRASTHSSKSDAAVGIGTLTGDRDYLELGTWNLELGTWNLKRGFRKDNIFFS